MGNCQHRVSEISMEVDTPCLLFDEAQLYTSLEIIRKAISGAPIELLYSMKACSATFVLELIAKGVSGFSCSSVFETRLAREVLQETASVHLTTPALVQSDVEQVAEICDFVSFNSLCQAERSRRLLGDDTSQGLRVNPKLSLLSDERYDPCRRASKLGVPIECLERVQREDPEVLKGIEGLHVHTNCDSDRFSDLASTVDVMHSRLAPTLARCAWVNLGGGYLFENSGDLWQLWSAVELLSKNYRVRIFLEPGAAIVRKCGSLVASVVDLFKSDGQEIAVLDTSVNHMPEVFEYQFEPDVLGHREGAPHRYLMAGSTCLAGDLFGEYQFDDPLHIGSRLVLQDMGSYTLVKAHWFNGVPLPNIYLIGSSGVPKLQQTFSYNNFKQLQGGDRDATLRDNFEGAFCTK